MIELDLTNVTADTPVPPELAALIADADARYAAALVGPKHRRDVAVDSTPTVTHTVKCSPRTNPCGRCCPTFYARYRARHNARGAL